MTLPTRLPLDRWGMPQTTEIEDSDAHDFVLKRSSARHCAVANPGCEFTLLSLMGATSHDPRISEFYVRSPRNR
jgi:hypothetical protein